MGAPFAAPAPLEGKGNRTTPPPPTNLVPTSPALTIVGHTKRTAVSVH